MFQLFLIGAYIVAVILDLVLGTVAVFSAITMLALVYTSVIVQIKRWHDRDKSGWWFFIGFIPIIGGLWVLVECGFLRGTAGPNRYGPDPLEAPASLVSPLPPAAPPVL